MRRLAGGDGEPRFRTFEILVERLVTSVAAVKSLLTSFPAGGAVVHYVYGGPDHPPRESKTSRSPPDSFRSAAERGRTPTNPYSTWISGLGINKPKTMAACGLGNGQTPRHGWPGDLDSKIRQLRQKRR